LILALAGGVGGAKLAHGLSMQLAPEQLQIVVNTGDDFVHLGLHISPDLDTVMYWLAGVSDTTRGWGRVDETWIFIGALEKLGGPAWFRLGDRDLAIHIERTRLLKEGQSLSDVTRDLCQRLGVHHAIVPMSDRRVPTIVHTSEGPLDFQDYFVRFQCRPRVTKLEYRGADKAAPSPTFVEAMWGKDLEAIIICPSNPMLSIDPILALPGVRTALQRRSPVIAVSPIVGGNALKGPAAKILSELGRVPSVVEIARHYADVIDGLVIDQIDAGLAKEVENLGIRVLAVPTIMTNQSDRACLADAVIGFAGSLRRR
jgi:LPPG:FO 2-phospho-L-lactate transferase